MNTFHLRVYEADDTFVEGEAESVIIPAVDGMYGVKAYHENVVICIEPGIMKYRMKDEEEKEAYLEPGIMRIEDNDVLILVDSATSPDDMEARRLQQEKEDKLEKELHRKSIEDFATAEATLRREAQKLKKK
ncbi:MAG: F0F1 ATP synthase subunit epsilon [Lachnospiraceae bacterium]|nr:F0F1 ATP synthase subunit epsilon [Lachnospiraceae bacterium]